MSLLISADPGKRTGIAVFEYETGKLRKKFIVLYDELTVLLSSTWTDINAFVVEDYIMRPGVGNRGHARGEAMRAIGQFEATAFRLGVPLFKQRPDCRLLAAKWDGRIIRKGHMPDDESAELHGIYYLRQHGKWKTVLERQRDAGI